MELTWNKSIVRRIEGSKSRTKSRHFNYLGMRMYSFQMVFHVKFALQCQEFLQPREVNSSARCSFIVHTIRCILLDKNLIGSGFSIRQAVMNLLVSVSSYEVRHQVMMSSFVFKYFFFLHIFYYILFIEVERSKLLKRSGREDLLESFIYTNFP